MQSPSAQAFLASYEAKDVYKVRINGISTATWDISPPSEDALIETLGDMTMKINLYTHISFTR